MSPSAKVWLGRVFSALCVAFTVASAVNVYGDNTEVTALAQSTAGCAGEGCSLARIDRTPFNQQFAFNRRGGGTTGVRCVRAALLVGPYDCQKWPP